MDQDILFEKEKLDKLEKGKSYPIEKSQTIYSAIRTNPDLFKNKEFSVRTDKKPTVLPSGESKFIQRVIRIK